MGGLAPVWVPVRRPGQPEDTAPADRRGGVVRPRCCGGLGWGVWAGRPRWVELPTYAFQRQRFWPRPGRGRGRLPVAGATVLRRGSGRRWSGRMWMRLAGALQVAGDAPLSRGAAGAVAVAGAAAGAGGAGWVALPGGVAAGDRSGAGDAERAVAAGGAVRAGGGGAGWRVVPGCWLTAARRWSPLQADLAGLDRGVLAARLGEVVADGGGGGCGVAAGLGEGGWVGRWRGRWCWCRRWGMRG